MTEASNLYLELTKSIPDFVNVDKDNIVDWLHKDDNDEGFKLLSNSNILVSRYDDTRGTPQHTDLEDDESDNDYSFGTKEECIETTQAINAVNVLNICDQENFLCIDVLNLRKIRTQIRAFLFQTEKNKN